MKIILCILIILLLNVVVGAHPGIGIVIDNKGNIFYTDLKQVWKLTPNGQKSVAVPNVHTHELYIDAEDNLFGEHLWYEGDATQKWGYRVWCLKPDGNLIDVIPAKEGFLKNYSFVRDAAGNMYWAEKDKDIIIRKRAPDGTITTHAKANFRDVRWMTVTPTGMLYLIDSGDLRQITSDGKVSTIVSRLSSKNPAPYNVSDRHYHMGLWTDKADNIYVVAAKENVVLKVRTDGTVTIVVKSLWDWAPSGGTFDRNGNMWILEHKSFPDSQRARMIPREQLTNEPQIVNNSSLFFSALLPVGLIALISLGIFILIKAKRRIKEKESQVLS